MNFLYKINRSLLLLGSLFLLGGILFVVAPAKAVERNPSILLARHLSLDLPDIKIDGKISIFSLNPLTGQLEIKSADGDPRRIFELISESSGLLHGLAKNLPIKQLTLKDCLITMTRDGVEFQFKSAVIPEGHLRDVSGAATRDKVWTVKSGEFYLNAFPFPQQEWQKLRQQIDLFPLGFSSLVASGQQNEGKIEVQKILSKGLKVQKLKMWIEQPKGQQFDISMDAEQLQVEEPSRMPDQTGLITQLLEYSGKAAQIGGLLTFDRMMVRGVVRNRDAFQVNPLRLSAPNLQIWGAVEGQQLPRPGSVQIDLTAKRPGRVEKSFHWQSEKR